jgi:hypothetical protein
MSGADGALATSGADGADGALAMSGADGADGALAMSGADGADGTLDGADGALTLSGAGGATTREASGDGADTCDPLSGVVVTDAASASAIDVVGMTTGADNRPTLAFSCSTMPSGFAALDPGAARTKPPMATPAIAPAVAATFQSSCLGVFMMISLCSVLCSSCGHRMWRS